MYENARVYVYTRIRESNRFSRSPDPEVSDARPVYYVSRRQTRINIRICTARIGVHLRHIIIIIIIGVRFAKIVFFSNAITGFKAPYIYISYTRRPNGITRAYSLASYI